VKDVKGHKSLVMEAKSDLGEVMDIVFKTRQQEEMSVILQQINSCIAKLFQAQLKK